jgi:hypothetical protein
MGIKRDWRGVRMGISHCWSHASGSSVVLSAVVSRSHFGSNERMCPRYGTVTGWSERISRSVVFFSLSSLHAASTKAGRGDRHEEEGTRQNYPGLFRAKRCDPKRTRFGLTTLSRAIAKLLRFAISSKTQDTIIHLREYRRDTFKKKIGCLF